MQSKELDARASSPGADHAYQGVDCCSKFLLLYRANETSGSKVMRDPRDVASPLGFRITSMS